MVAMPFKTIDMKREGILILDQRKLPNQVKYLLCKNAECVIDAIKKMVIRGAPAIGVAAAMGLALGTQQIKTSDKRLFFDEFDALCHRFAASRPTAVNLFWAIERMKTLARNTPLLSIKKTLEAEAVTILREDIAINQAMGNHGKTLVPDTAGILTHCNAGALATGGFGTALGVIYAAFNDKKKIHVYADETRPVLQGARLTTWELKQHGVPVTLITEGMAGTLMKEEAIDLVIVGADRIAKNGDTANKIGTYGVAVLAHHHGIPFYVAAPFSTFDTTAESGTAIPIEYRDEKEVFYCGRKRIAPRGIEVFNPAFDVTPASLITAIITERGILQPPFEAAIAHLATQTGVTP